jgi:myosin heavy subunit
LLAPNPTRAPLLAGVVPGGPADKYDHTVPQDRRIEAHDTILSVDGECATEANILRLLRGDGKVNSSAIISVQKFGKPVGSRDSVEVTLHRDYKWWVEGMRDVAVAVEQVSYDMEGHRGSRASSSSPGRPKSQRANEEGLMHTVWQMEVNKQLRKLSSLSARSQKNLRAHIESLENELIAALKKAHEQRTSIERHLIMERDDAVGKLEDSLREQQEALAAAPDPVVLDRYRDMISTLQQEVQVTQAKNLDLVNQMHSVRMENERRQAALSDSHAMETRAAFMTVREVEEKNSHALAALKKSHSELEPVLLALSHQDEADERLALHAQELLDVSLRLQRSADHAENRKAELEEELQVALQEVSADSLFACSALAACLDQSKHGLSMHMNVSKPEPRNPDLSP